jgi:hypothetical protein
MHLQLMGGETRLFMRNSGNFVTQPESQSLVPSRFESVCAEIPPNATVFDSRRLRLTCRFAINIGSSA